MRIIVGISGASGVVMGYEMLKALRMQEDCEIHLVITQGAIENFKYETDMDIKEVMKLADYCYDDKNMAASISSGSFRTDGMIVIPCSMKTVSAIANGYGANPSCPFSERQYSAGMGIDATMPTEEYIRCGNKIPQLVDDPEIMERGKKRFGDRF